MRSGPNTRRPMRRGGGGGGGQGQGRRGGSQRSQNFDSSGPDIKVRGTAQQVVDKYQTLAREAATAGDPVGAENYYQHAEHYYRVLHANGGGADNRQGGRQPDGDRNQDNERAREDNGRNETQQGRQNGADEETPVTAAPVEQPAVQPTEQPVEHPANQPTEQSAQPPAEGRQNGQNGRKRSRPARNDGDGEPAQAQPEAAAPEQPEASSPKETGEPVA